MTAPAAWRAHPIFLASIFCDIHAEREYLRRVMAFPDILTQAGLEVYRQ